MRTANVDGLRTVATKGAAGVCPGCGAQVGAKCGSVISWHWAHVIRTSCDWYPGETQWHLDWKSAAPVDRQEITIGSNRADIVSPGGTVVELQHSHLTREKIDQRERAYGQMAWLFDVRKPFAAGRLKLMRHPDWKSDDRRNWVSWDKPQEFPKWVTKPLFLDLGEEIFWVGESNLDAWWSFGFAGWLVPHRWFKRAIVNGHHLPAKPPFDLTATAGHLEALAWTIPSSTTLRASA